MCKLTCENYILKSFCRHKFKNASIIGDIYGERALNYVASYQLNISASSRMQ